MTVEQAVLGVALILVGVALLLINGVLQLALSLA